MEEIKKVQSTMNKHLIILTAIFSLSLTSIHTCYGADRTKEYDEANIEGRKGIDLINDGRFDEGLELIKSATEIAPEIPEWHMNYGSLLMMKGQQDYSRSGNIQERDKVFRDVEAELLRAIELFGDKHAPSKSHCYFLLGDTYFYVFSDKVKAKHYYETSLKYNPEHGLAINALKRLNEGK